MYYIEWSESSWPCLSDHLFRSLPYIFVIESNWFLYLPFFFFFNDTATTEISTFLACWVYEETFHGIALARFLEAAGHPLEPRARPHGREPLSQRIEAAATAMVSKAWPDFCAVHMTWGAINELTTLTGYRRLVTVACHPVP